MCPAKQRAACYGLRHFWLVLGLTVLTMAYALGHVTEGFDSPESGFAANGHGDQLPAGAWETMSLQESTQA